MNKEELINNYNENSINTDDKNSQQTSFDKKNLMSNLIIVIMVLIIILIIAGIYAILRDDNKSNTEDVIEKTEIIEPKISNNVENENSYKATTNSNSDTQEQIKEQPRTETGNFWHKKIYINIVN